MFINSSHLGGPLPPSPTSLLTAHHFPDMAGRTPIPPHEEIDRTSRGHERRVVWRHIPQIAEAMGTAKEEGYHLVALETAQGAKCFLEYEFPRKICLTSKMVPRWILL